MSGLDPAPDAKPAAAPKPAVGRLDPLAIAEQALGGASKPGAADAAASVLLAIGDAGWILYHRDAPADHLHYGLKVTVDGEAT